MSRAAMGREAFMRAIAASPAANPVMDRTLHARTGDLAKAVGVFRPRLVVSPELYDAPRFVRQFVLYHEMAHVVLRHGLWLAAAKAIGVLHAFAFAFVVALLLSRDVVASTMLASAVALLEVRCELFALPLRRSCESEADVLALAVVPAIHYAKALSVLHKLPKRGFARWATGYVYGRTWRERALRVGVVSE